MDEITIFWTKTAIKQRNHVFEYWNKRNFSIAYSVKLNLMIKESLNLLKSYTKIGKMTEFKGTRAIFITYYSLLYKIEDNKIIVTGFWDNRQDSKKLNKFLKDN